MTRSAVVGALSFFVLTSVFAQGPPEWQADVEAMLHEFMTCQSPIDDVSPCNRFVGRALKRIYNIDDFTKPNGEFMTANEIAGAVAASGNWTKLGNASDQKALNEAQGYANVKKAIIAVSSGSPHGHVAIILPGSQTQSGSWGLKVPNSASFFLNKPDKSYIGKPLSFAWTTPNGVSIYGRNF
jgi:hypothetical protein